MRRTGRELTLFSIYGAPDAPPPSAARKPKSPAPSRRPLRVSKPQASDSAAKPTRPPPRVTQEQVVGGCGEVERVGGGSVAEKTSNQSSERDSGRVGADSAAINPDLRVELAPKASSKSPKREPADTVASPPKSPDARVEIETREKDRAPPKAVMSLYGDGFIELAPRDSSQRSLGVPFSLRIRMFKAADELKDKDKVESDASRHISPELNDDGEFVRWSCCGSTDKSVYGCPVASDEQTQDLGVDELLKLRPPKLLACKLADADDKDDVQFVIFDRGYPGDHHPRDYGALSAGCRVWWRGYECWSTNYDVPHGRWLDFVVSFDGYYLRVAIDDEVVDTAVVQHCSREPSPLCRGECVLACRCPGSQWSTSSSETKSIYIGGYAKYSTSVSKWRSRAGFVGLIACVSLSREDKKTYQGEDSHIVSVDIGDVKDVSQPRKFDIVIHRNVFWRKVFPPFVASSDHGLIHLRSNFYHGAHHDISPRNPNSFENILLSVVQTGDVRIRIAFSREFESNFGSDHGCRTQIEYDTKCGEFIRHIEQLSHLLGVVVNPSGVEPPKGSFEVFIELSRSPGASPVSILLHSMVMTSCFPSRKDFKAKIVDVITHEARRSPGEEVVQQAVRHFLSLASQARDSRERVFMESVINRKALITEKRILAVFQRLGFHFSPAELHEVIRTFKTMQDEFLRHQNRMEDIPTMSLIAPTSMGMYRLPLIHRVSLSSITPSERTASRSPWSFVAIMLNYDLQLLDFIHEGCPESTYGSAAYAQSRYLHGGFVDRLSLQISELPSHVYCVVISLRRHHPDHPSTVSKDSNNHGHRSANEHEISEDSGSTILVQLENGETLQQLAQFETRSTSDCKWFSLAALYRSRKSKLWRFQALGGSTQAASIHSGLEEMNAILVERHIVQVYEVRISYEDEPVFTEFAGRFSKNIRFGRNGKIVMHPREKATEEKLSGDAGDRAGDLAACRPAKFQVVLRIQGMDRDINVYQHNDSASSLPTVQSICRSILRTLAEHGIKESLQQNPFIAGAKKLKRLVTIRITSEDTNTPVDHAYVFIERSVDNQHAVASLASKIVPTLTMGSRLVSIRKRLQKKKYSDEVKQAAREFVLKVIDLGTRYAIVSLRDAKLVPIVNSRALLRRAMRHRREMITRRILEAMSESERSRIYSRNGPIRLQQLLRPQLSFSNSERELVNEIVEMEIENFRQELGLVETKEVEETPQDHIEEVWRSQIKDGRSPSVVSVNGDDQPKDAKAIELIKKLAGNSQNTADAKEPKKRSFVTNDKGVVTCHLAPGSYSLYVFHTDYFEWTSLAVVFPTVNASGLYGSSLSTSAPQEIVIPLETFKWSYGIQLVDFYQQHIQKLVEGVPILITDKCTSEQLIVKTQADGSVAWDVRKGIYSIRALTENTSIVYSGSKNVVVDGGRYHPPRTIFIPVLLGKTAIQLVVCSALSTPTASFESLSAAVQFFSDTEAPPEKLPSKVIPETEDPAGELRAAGASSMELNSSSTFQLRPGNYTLSIVAEGFFAYSSLLNAPWNANGSLSSRNVVVLCPIFTAALEYRVIFSSANATGVIDAMLDVKLSQAVVRTHWAHGTQQSDDEVEFHGSAVMDACEFQAFTLRCFPGRCYQLRIGSTVRERRQLQYLSPRVHVYASTGLIFDATLHDDLDWNETCYWQACEWNARGEFVEKDKELVEPVEPAPADT